MKISEQQGFWVINNQSFPMILHKIHLGSLLYLHTYLSFIINFYKTYNLILINKLTSRYFSDQNKNKNLNFLKLLYKYINIYIYIYIYIYIFIYIVKYLILFLK